MNEDEVLAAGLAYKAGIGDVAVQMAAGLLPQALEGGGGAGEVDAGKVFRLGGYLADKGAAAGQEVFTTPSGRPASL